MAVNHKDITGDQLHEPKGIETASSGEVYIADGVGSGSWASPSTAVPDVKQGWGSYKDTGAAQTFTTTPSILTNNKGTVIETYLPPEILGSDTLWSADKMRAIGVGDTYDIRLDLPITSKTASPTKIIVTLDIGGGLTITNPIVVEEISITGATPYTVSTTISLYSLATFVGNGMSVFLATDTGSLNITNPAIFIKRTS